MTKFPRWRALGAIYATSLFLAGTAIAQDFPSRPLRLVVAYAPGGGSDAAARQITGNLGESLKQPVIVDNRPGGNSALAVNYVASQPADGYTLLMTDLSQFAVNPHVFKKLTYEPAGFEPVGMLFRFPFMLVVNASNPAKNLKEFVSNAKARPSGINYGSAGTGTPIHLGMEIVKSATGIQALHVPYKGMAPALNDLMGGQVEAVFTDVGTGLPFVKSGKLKALAVSSATRSVNLPDVPTFIEAGYPKVQLEGWFGIMAKRGTPPSAIKTLNAAVINAVADPRISDWMRSIAATPAGLPNTSEDYARILKADYQTWGNVARDLNVNLD